MVDLYAEDFWTELLNDNYFFEFSEQESNAKVNESFCEIFAGLRYEIMAKLEPLKIQLVFDYLKNAILVNRRESIQLTGIDTLMAITITNTTEFFTNRYCYQTIFNVIVKTLTTNSNPLRLFGDKIKDRAAQLLGSVTDTFVHLAEPDQIIDFVRDILPIVSYYSPVKQWRIVGKLVHAANNLFVTLQRHQSNDSFRLIFETNSSKIIQFLLDCLSNGRCLTSDNAQQPNVKVKWNVCYSFASILQVYNEHVLAIEKKLFIEIVDRLTIELETSSNFKVRTNASLALKAIIDRDSIEDRYMRIWNVLVRALIKAEEISDFKEYEHQKSLKEQICVTIVHWMTMMKENDLTELNDDDDDVFERNSLEFQNQLQKFDGKLLDFQKRILLELIGGEKLKRSIKTSESTPNN